MFTQHRNLFALGLALASLLLLGGRVTAAVSVGDRTGAAPTQGDPAAPFAVPTSSCSTASFGPATDFAVGGSPQAVAVGDFNRDGNPDLAVANSSVNTVSVRLGNGTGGFGAATIFFVSFNPYDVEVGDFNRDGFPDLVTANYNSDSVSVLLGNGDGTFAPETHVTQVGSSPAAVAVGDFNGDGQPDLVMTNSGGSSVSVLLGDGGGGFSPASGSPFAVGTSPYDVAVGDFNVSDGRPGRLPDPALDAAGAGVSPHPDCSDGSDRRPDGLYNRRPTGAEVPCARIPVMCGNPIHAHNDSHAAARP